MRAHPASTLPLLPGALALLAALAVTAPGYAQNLIPTNPEFDGFDAGFAGWETTSVFPAVGDDADGCPDSGSFRAESDSGNLVIVRASECIVAVMDDVFHLEARYRSPDVPVDLLLLQFSDANCDVGLITALEPALAPSADWTIAHVTATVGSSLTDSVRFAFVAGESDTGYVTEFDRAYMGTVERVFADDFDGGGVCRWSDVVDGLSL